MLLSFSALLLPLALATPVTHPAATSDAQTTLAPLSSTGETIEDSYIVMFKKGVNLNQIALHLSTVEDSHTADVSVV